MQQRVFGLCLMLVFWAVSSLGDQRVVIPLQAGETPATVVDRTFMTALEQEVQASVDKPLTPSRLKAVMEVLGPQRHALVQGYSEVSADPGGAAAGGNATQGNATGQSVTLDVRIHTDALRARLRETGVAFTASAPWPYVLQLSGVEPSRTKRLGFLQELSGLQPVAAGGEDVPVLALSQAGPWTGVLTLGQWSATHTAKSLDEVWLTVWKGYFSRPGLLAKGESGLEVRVSGWLSSMGPMEFDRLMDSWTREIEKKSLVGVEMEGAGLAGVWRIQTRSRDALVGRLRDAAKAQGLSVDVR